MLKTIAAMIIALGHFFFWRRQTNRFPATFFLAVDFFFIASGFSLMNSMYRKGDMSFEDYCKNLIVSRITRLWVPYVLMALICIGIHVYTTGEHMSLSSISMVLFCGQAWGFSFGENIISNSTIGIAWCLSVELYLSILWFPVMFKVRKHKWEIGLFLSLVVFVCLHILVNYSEEFMGITYARLPIAGLSLPGGVVRGILGYALGGLVYFARQFIAGQKNIKNLSTEIWTLSELMLVVLIVSVFGRTMPDRRNEYLFPFFMTLLVLVFTLERGLCSKVLSKKCFAQISSLFFGIYLVHPMAIQLLDSVSGGGNKIYCFYGAWRRNIQGNV